MSSFQFFGLQFIPSIFDLSRISHQAHFLSPSIKQIHLPNIMSRTTGTSPDIPILFEDNHLLVVCKPVNLLSQEDHTGDPDLLNLCKAYLKKQHQKPGNVFLGLLHRLDRPVGGVMVLAKTSKAASRLSEQIRQRSFQKRYLLVVKGETPPNAFLVHHLLKDPVSNRVKVVSQRHKKAKKAELSYLRLDYNSTHNLSLVQANLITGRPHQIRVQFSAEGFPLLGDKKYGEPDGPADSPALFASGISFRHPTLGSTVSYSASPPDTEPWTLFEQIRK
jgi:23S rRNA pseudouridine1911/1915/1917 synthase